MWRSGLENPVFQGSAARERNQGQASKLAGVCGQRGGGAGTGNSSQGRVSGEVESLAASSSPSRPLAPAHAGQPVHPQPVKGCHLLTPSCGWSS